MKKIDLSGTRYGRLVVGAFAGNNKHGKRLWECLCDCGNSTTVNTSHLRGGCIQSCGCLKKEAFQKVTTKHGLSTTPEYGHWKAMWGRCRNRNSQDYQAYKDRTPPPEWEDFSVFYKDMGPRPTACHSIDRINNSQPYGPLNCRWATPIEQARNKGANQG